MFYLLAFPRGGYTEYYAVDSSSQTCSDCRQRIEDAKLKHPELLI